MRRRAGLDTADRLVAVCGADSTNTEIAVKAMRLAHHRSSSPLDILVHIVDPRIDRAKFIRRFLLWMKGRHPDPKP